MSLSIKGDKPASQGPCFEQLLTIRLRRSHRRMASQVSRFEQLPTFALNSAYIRPTSQGLRFGQLLTLAGKTQESIKLCRYRASGSYLPYFASFSGWILLRGYRASSSYLPQNFVRIHAHRLRKYGVSRDYSLSINMDFPTLMLRRHRTSSRYLYHKAVKAMGVHVLQISYFGQLLYRRGN